MPVGGLLLVHIGNDRSLLNQLVNLDWEVVLVSGV